MSQFTKILVATDGSPTSGAAVDRALGFASEPGASVTFLHVVEPTEWRLARGAQAMPMAVERHSRRRPGPRWGSRARPGGRRRSRRRGRLR